MGSSRRSSPMISDETRPSSQSGRSSQIQRTAIIVPARGSAYGKTPEWVEKSTKDFLDNLPSRNHLKSLNYTKPEVRERLKKRIMAGSKGGRPGQWSARKAQLLALAYRKAGGGYRGKLGKTQRSLKKWTKERWTTADGKPALRRGKMSRYLPAAAWRRLTPSQRKATIAKKLAGDKRGRQFVPNTSRAASASKKIRSRKSAATQGIATKGRLDENNERRLAFESSTINVDSLPSTKMPDGSVVSIRPITFEHEDMFVVIPTITESGELLSDSQAITKFLKSNWHLGKFGESRSAERYASLLKDRDNEKKSQFVTAEGTEVGSDKKRYIDARAVREQRKQNADVKSRSERPESSGTRESYMSRFDGSK